MKDNYIYTYPGTNITLQQIQEVEFEILVEFDRVCKLLNIPYQLYAGTLLGAVRHKDFIPWDDDIDVCMLRKDFDRFVAESGMVLNKKYFLQTAKTDPKSVVQFAKIRKNGTVYENDVDNLPDTNTGIWIDIFPFDNIKAGTIFDKIQCLEVMVLYAMITSTVDQRVDACKTTWKKILRIVFHQITKVIPKSVIEKRLYNVMTRYAQDEVEYLRSFTNGSVLNSPRKVRKAEGFYDLIPMQFHKSVFTVPRNYDEILTGIYGDYMKLPPLEKRVPQHGVVRIDLGKDNSL